MPSVSPLVEDPPGSGIHDEDDNPIVLCPPGDEVDRPAVDGLPEPSVEVISWGAGGDGRKDLGQRQEAAIAHGVPRPVLFRRRGDPLGDRGRRHASEQEDGKAKEGGVTAAPAHGANLDRPA
jgi:hypothetical protein